MHNMFYVSLMVTTKQKPRVGSQTIKRRELQHTTKENHLFAKEGSQRGRRGKVTIKLNKMAVISPLLSLITLNVNRLTLQSKGIGQLDRLEKKKRPNYMLPT